MAGPPVEVLLVEDEPGDARLISEMLKDVGGDQQVRLRLAECLADGLKQAGDSSIAAVLLDLGLPDSEGLATLDRVQEREPRLPIIVLTGLDDESVAVDAVRRGAQDYLVKGTVDGELLSRSIRYAIERKSVKAALAESESRYRSVVEGSMDGIFLLDLEGVVRMANRKAAELTGYDDPQGLVGRRSADLLLPEHRDEFERWSRRMMEEDKPIRREAVVLKRDGTRFPAEIAAALFKDGEGRPAGIELTVRDVSERKQVEQAKADFLSAVSHELRTPLTIILGNCDLAERIPASERAGFLERALSTIKERGQAMAHLVEDLLYVTGMESGRLELAMSEADLGELVRRCVAEVPITGEHTLSVQVEEGLPPCPCDPERLGYAVSNLIANAVKFSPDGGVVGIAVGYRDGSFTISVSDEGVGIPPDQIDSIFEPFSQGDMSSTRRFGGVGLGLFVVSCMVEAHGGHTEVDSTPGAGSVFTILIPDAGRDA